jgi:hypothetical protein
MSSSGTHQLFMVQARGEIYWLKNQDQGDAESLKFKKDVRGWFRQNSTKMRRKRT